MYVDDHGESQCWAGMYKGTPLSVNLINIKFYQFDHTNHASECTSSVQNPKVTGRGSTQLGALPLDFAGQKYLLWTPLTPLNDYMTESMEFLLCYVPSVLGRGVHSLLDACNVTLYPASRRSAPGDLGDEATIGGGLSRSQR